MPFRLGRIGDRVSVRVMSAAGQKDKQAAREIAAAGVTLLDWSTEDRKEFRSFAKKRWKDWKSKSPAAAALVDSHVQFMTDLGLVD